MVVNYDYWILLIFYKSLIYGESCDLWIPPAFVIGMQQGGPIELGWQL